MLFFMATRFSIKNILRSKVGVILVLVVLGLLVYGVWRSFWKSDENAVIYTTETVVRGDIENLVTATGTIQPRDYVDVGAQVSGQLEKLHVDVGSEVKAGDLLAEIDATVYAAKVDATRAQLRNQQAQLLDREAQLQLANINFQRTKNLFKEEAATDESLQTAEASLKSAQAQLKALQAQIEQTESTLRVEAANLNYAKIYAPIDGTVVSITSRQGQTLNTNQMAPTIMRVADLSTMTVQTQVSEADIGKLRTEMPVYFTTLGSQGRRWYSKLDRIQPTPEVLNNVVLYNALFDVPNENRELMTQMSTQVFFIESQAKDTLVVPMSAISFASPRGERQPGAEGNRNKTAGTNGLSDTQKVERKKSRENADSTDVKPAGRLAMVKIMKADGSLEDRRVLVGVASRVQAQILDGLVEGEKVVSGSSRAGQPVKAAPANWGGPGMGRR
jgi:macrolide-specific efflux system membrane fusion protein